MGCASLIDLDYLGYLGVAYWLNIYKLNIFKYYRLNIYKC